MGYVRKIGTRAIAISEKAVNYANDTLLIRKDIGLLYQYNGKPGVLAEYFDNEKTGRRTGIQRRRKEINHHWSEGEAPYTGLRSAHYSARYTTFITAASERSIEFRIGSQQWLPGSINDIMVVGYREQSRRAATDQTSGAKKEGPINCEESFRPEGDATVKLVAGNYVKTDFTALANRLKDADAILFVRHLHNSKVKMPVAVPGFKGGDRTSILLPAVQTALIMGIE